MSTPSKTLNEFLYSPQSIEQRRREAVEAEAEANVPDRELSPETKAFLEEIKAQLKDAKP